MAGSDLGSGCPWWLAHQYSTGRRPEHWWASHQGHPKNPTRMKSRAVETGPGRETGRSRDESGSTSVGTDGRTLACARCATPLRRGEGNFYVVRIVAVADPDPPVFTEEDLARDVGPEIEALLAR